VKAIRDEGRRVSIETVKEVGRPESDPTPDIERFLEHFFIPPVNLDPAGIVGKLEQLLNVRESRFEEEVRAMAPNASDSEVNNLENLLEAALALNVYYKVIRHFYLLGKRTMNIYVIMQIHMILPLLMREIEAYSAALQAFREGMPIGDGVGALTAAKLMHGYPSKEVAKDMVAAEVPMEGRILVVMKAKGPGGNVGKPGDAVERVLRERKGEVKAIIMIDAAGKLEGEPTGAVAEGVGAAIGGVGVEKYKIEEAAKAHDIPLYAVAVKEDISHVVAPMVEELFDATDKAVESVRRLVEERSEEGDVVIVAGIGNTVGIGQ
ncbi:MAG: DUF1512 family protein, partial [Candidatus Bathyarchaeia archaeon]